MNAVTAMTVTSDLMKTTWTNDKGSVQKRLLGEYNAFSIYKFVPQPNDLLVLPETSIIFVIPDMRLTFDSPFNK